MRYPLRIRRARVFRTSESGQALVEFALVVPIFILLVLGIVEFARAWNIYEVLTDAGREGARRAVVEYDNITAADVITTIQQAGNRVGITIDASDITMTNFGAGRSTIFTVRIEYDHELKWVGTLLGVITGDPNITMVSEFAMRNE
jgi:Flp pilus assembly protein TadG